MNKEFLSLILNIDNTYSLYKTNRRLYFKTLKSFTKTDKDCKEFYDIFKILSRLNKTLKDYKHRRILLEFTDKVTK